MTMNLLLGFFFLKYLSQRPIDILVQNYFLEGEEHLMGNIEKNVNVHGIFGIVNVYSHNQ